MHHIERVWTGRDLKPKLISHVVNDQRRRSNHKWKTDQTMGSWRRGILRRWFAICMCQPAWTLTHILLQVWSYTNKHNNATSTPHSRFRYPWIHGSLATSLLSVPIFPSAMFTSLWQFFVGAANLGLSSSLWQDSSCQYKIRGWESLRKYSSD